MNIKTIKRILLNIVLWSVALFCVFPLLTIIITAFKGDSQVVNDPYGLVPRPFTLQAFQKVFTEFPFLKYLGNTMIICITTVIATPLTSSMAGYAFSKFEVNHKKYLFGVMFAMIMVPGTILQLPTFELYRKLNWINTFYPFIVPAFLGGGITNVFLVRQFMNSLSPALFEAAEIDGANELTIFFKIAIPLSAPIIITIGVFTFCACWNDFFSAYLYLNDENMYTLGYGLYIFISQCKIGTLTAWNVISAASVLVMIPMFLVYAFAQKYFTEGIQVGGVKG